MPKTSSSSSSRLWLVAALMMLALVLRVINLERRPLHFDEGINVKMGHQSPAGILNLSRETYDNDPPGHRLVLSVWMTLAGSSPFSIRFLSVLFGVLTVAVAYRVSRRLGLTPWAGTMAAVMIAVTPYAIEYSQQAKGYAMGAAMAMLSWWAWVSLGEQQSYAPRARFFTAFIYILSTALALSTHYYTVFLLLMQWLWLIGTTWSAVRGRIGAWVRAEGWWRLAAQAFAFAPVGIWIVLLWRTLMAGTVRSSYFEPATLPVLLTRILGEMSVGQFADAMLTTLSAALFAALALLGSVRLWLVPRTGSEGNDAKVYGARRHMAFWFGLAFLVPVASAFVLQQRFTFFFPRFLLYALPNLSVLVAGCTLAFKRQPGKVAFATRRAPALAVMVFMLAGNAAFQTAPINTEDDYRPIVAQLRPLVKPGDAVLGAYIWMEGMFMSYAPETSANLTWYDDVYSPETVDALLEPIACNHDRVWSINFRRDPDAPDTLSTLWLKRHGAYADRYSSGVTSVLLFNTPCPTTSEPLTNTLPLETFGGNIRLEYEFVARQVTQGDTLDVTLRWSTLQSIGDYLTPFVQLIGPNGQLVAQNDGDAMNGLAPSFTWKVGEPIIDRRAVLIRTPLAPGDYTLIAGIYRHDDGTRMATSTGADSVQIGNIKVKD